MRRTDLRLAFSFLALVAGGCDDSTSLSPDVADIVIHPALDTLLEGDSRMFTATLADAEGHSVSGPSISWRTGDPAIASLGAATGPTTIVTAGTTGTVSITASSQGVSDSATLVVRERAPWEVIASGSWHTCGLAARAVYCWGRDDDGQLGTGTPRAVAALRPVPLGDEHRFRVLAAGAVHACALAEDGVARCWGYNKSGQLGDGTTHIRESGLPEPVAGGPALVQIAAGGVHSCGLTATGAAWCWGGAGGVVGDGTPMARSSPTRVAGGLSFLELSSGAAHTCALTSGGAAYCWGSNGGGQLGDGTRENRYAPAPVLGGLAFTAIAAGGLHTCGITVGGAAYCWGYNRVGQLGDGSTIDRLAPAPVSGGVSFRRITAGFLHSCGLTGSGAAFCWGDDSWGQLGDGGSSGSRTVPTAVAGGAALERISAGRTHTCGFTAAGIGWCWGGNAFGQLGDGTTATRIRPVAASGVPR